MYVIDYYIVYNIIKIFLIVLLIKEHNYKRNFEYFVLLIFMLYFDFVIVCNLLQNIFFSSFSKIFTDSAKALSGLVSI